MQEQPQSDQQQRARSWWADPMVIAVNALGITQITAWGTSYYCLGVLATPIVAETGWAMSTVFLGFSVALLVMGVLSPWIGSLIDRMGARVVMVSGTIIVSTGLLALAQVRDPVSYWVVWAVLGLGMRCCLYDAAFAALVQVTPTRGRTAISYLTLYGAYASTVFWVIGHYLTNGYGWRGTLMIFAVINLIVCLPLTWVGLARREVTEDPAAATQGQTASEGPVLRGRRRVVGMILFALIMSLNGFVFGIVSLQLVPLLKAAGLTSAAAVWIASLKGHGQCAGRVIEICFGRRLKAMTIARIALGGVPVAWLLFLLAQGGLWGLAAFTVSLGATQGVITIVRGAVPLALFGTQGYGTVLGLLATPILLVNAFSPALFPLVMDRFGQQTSLYALLGCSLITWVAIELMSRWYESAQQHRVTGEVSSVPEHS